MHNLWNHFLANPLSGKHLHAAAQGASEFGCRGPHTVPHRESSAEQHQRLSSHSGQFHRSASQARTCSCTLECHSAGSCSTLWNHSAACRQRRGMLRVHSSKCLSCCVIGVEYVDVIPLSSQICDGLCPGCMDPTFPMSALQQRRVPTEGIVESMYVPAVSEGNYITWRSWLDAQEQLPPSSES